MGVFKPECPSNGVVYFYISELPTVLTMSGNSGHEKIVISTGRRNLLFPGNAMKQISHPMQSGSK